MRPFNVWVSGFLTLCVFAAIGKGDAVFAALDTLLAVLNLYIGLRK